MSDQAKVDELLSKYTPEQLARAYLKASRERNEAVKLANDLRDTNALKEKLGIFGNAFGV